MSGKAVNVLFAGKLVINMRTVSVFGVQPNCIRNPCMYRIPHRPLSVAAPAPMQPIAWITRALAVMGRIWVDAADKP